MSTIKLIGDSYKTPAAIISEVNSLELFDTQVNAIRDLVYDARVPVGFAPVHDHQEDGGATLGRPILTHSFGLYLAEWTVALVTQMGLPIGVPPSTGDPSTQKTFGPVVTNGLVDESGAKRMFNSVVLIPGGVRTVAVGVTMINTNAGTDVTLVGTFRHLQDINLGLGKAAVDVRATITVTRSGAGSELLYYFAAESEDLAALGDTTQDREVEFSLWLNNDEGFNFFDDRICHLEILPYSFNSFGRSARPDDVPQPRVSVREVQKNKGIWSPVLGTKLKEAWNNLNRGVFGTTPGLLPSGQPDPDRRYIETVDDCHRHQGIAVPDVDNTVFSDGAVLADYQSIAYIQKLGGGDVGTSTSNLNSDPVQGRLLHSVANLSTGWTYFQFRRSIPAGLGALLMRFGINARPLEKTATLLASVSITPVEGGDDIVTRTQCVSFLSEVDTGSADLGYCEIQPRADPGYVSNKALFRGGIKPWSRGAEIATNSQTAQGMLPILTRVSEPLIVKLTYPPRDPLDPRHKTGDYDVKVRFKLRLTPGGSLYDTSARCQFITCWSMPGF